MIAMANSRFLTLDGMRSAPEVGYMALQAR
jgi:hypothetical protein